MDEVLISMARSMATRGTCSRGKVGAVLARDGRVLSTGYNGAPSGLPHCAHPTHETDPISKAPSSVDTCGSSVHAEANAVAFAARNVVPVDGATLYCTHAPCLQCAFLIINAGVSRVVYERGYRDPRGLEKLAEAGVGILEICVGGQQ